MSGLPYSSRQRVLISLVVVMAVILSCIGFFAQQTNQHETDEIFSARLATSARVLESLLARQLEKATINSPLVITLPGGLEGDAEDNALTMGHPYESKIAFQVWNSEEILLARSTTAPVQPLGPMLSGFHERVLDNVLWHVFALQSGPIWILVAEKNEVREEIEEAMALSVLAPLLVGSLLLIVLVNWIVLRAMQPVQDLAAMISSRDPLSLEPIRLHKAPRELIPVIDQLNQLFDRVHQAVAREKRFMDSAAHELRTPITAIQLHLQNALESSLDHDRQESLEKALAASRRAARLAEQLLAFSRLSASDSAEQSVDFFLSDLCADVIGNMRPILDRRSQRVIFHGDPGARVHGEKTKIERLIQNLLDNASLHGDSPGEIDVVVATTESGVELFVENDGPSIPDSEKKRIFIPYFRLLGSGATGSGLGLAIVQEIADQHGVQLTVEDKSEKGGVRLRALFKRTP